MDAIKDATNMNLNILGRALVPVAVTSENVVFDGGCRWVWARGLESKSGSGWFERAQSVAFERRGWSDSRAFVSEELKRRFNLIRVCSEGRMNAGFFGFSSSSSVSKTMSTSTSISPSARSRSYSSSTGLTNPGHLAAAMYCNSYGL